MSRSLVIVTVIAVIFADPSFSRSDEKQTQTANVRLFELGWNAKLTERSAADNFFSTQAAVVADPRFNYAYSLLLLKQRRYREADEYLRSLQKALPNDLRVLGALSWAQILTRKYPSALGELERLSQVVAVVLYAKDGTPRDLKPAQRAEADFALRHLGEMLAFLDHPLKQVVSVQLRSQHRDRIVARFKGPDLDQFRKAQQRVVDQFSQLERKLETEARLAKVQDEKRRQQDLSDLQDIRKSIDKRRTELADRKDKLRDETQKKKGEISERARPLNRELSSIQARAGMAARQAAQIQLDLSIAYRQLRRARDPILRGIIRRDISRLESLQARYDADLYLADLRASSVFGERARLAAESNRVDNALRSELKDNATEQSRLDKREKRTAVHERRLRDNRGGTSRLVRAMLAKARSLATYSSFSLESEKQRLTK